MDRLQLVGLLNHMILLRSRDQVFFVHFLDIYVVLKNFTKTYTQAFFDTNVMRVARCRMYSSLETQGEEGAACSLASVTSLSDADAAFHGQRVHVTTDSSDASIDTAGRSVVTSL